MAKGGKATKQRVVYIKLRSSESTHQYYTKKNKKNTPDRLEIKKYDPTLKKHVLYKETKK